MLISDPSFLSSCQVIPTLVNSDHCGIITKLLIKSLSKNITLPSRVIWLYSHADWSLATDLICDYDWDSILTSNVNTSWSKWYKIFLSIMEECIPKKRITSRTNLPWLNNEIRQAMKRRDILFKHSGYSASYKAARNSVVALLRKAKSEYFLQLNPKDSSKFWKAVKYLNEQQSVIPDLVQDQIIASTDRQKAEVLNSFFANCFNRSLPALTIQCICLVRFARVPLINLNWMIYSVLLKKLSTYYLVLMYLKPMDLIWFQLVC